MVTKEEWKAKTDRLERARIKAEQFVAAGGDLMSTEAVPLGLELINAFNEVSTLFGQPILQPKEQISPGIYLQQQIEQRSRAVAKTNNAAGYIAMWPAAVRDVMARFPSLSSAEKMALRSNVEAQIQLFCTRTGSDPHQFTSALQEIARLLGR
jgi:hypothetical protein